MRRVVLKSPVLENCTPGSVRGAPGNRRPYLDKMGFFFIFLSLIFLSADLPPGFLAAGEQARLLQCKG